jgi:hypothetical protein
VLKCYEVTQIVLERYRYNVTTLSDDYFDSILKYLKLAKMKILFYVYVACIKSLSCEKTLKSKELEKLKTRWVIKKIDHE